MSVLTVALRKSLGPIGCRPNQPLPPPELQVQGEILPQSNKMESERGGHPMSSGSHVLTGMHTLHVNLHVNAPCTRIHKKRRKKNPSQVEMSLMT